MKILFVDEEPLVLEALERALFGLENDWETRFVSSGDAALAELSKRPYDVIVCELRLPGVSGVALLKRVAELYPRTVRIVLSSQPDDEASLIIVDYAHQFLAKPCAVETIHQIIARTQSLMQLLPDRKLQTLVAQTRLVPCAAHLQRQITGLLERRTTDATVPALTRLIQQDPGFTSKLLQVAGSTFFTSASSVADVETAVMRLGLATVKQLLRSFGTSPYGLGSQSEASSVEDAQARSLEIAELAATMTRLPEDAGTAYLAGLLCDVGQLVLVHAAPERVYLSQAESAQRGVSAHQAELETWGVSHAELGAYLLGLWGLPFQVVEAVAHHHAPDRHAEDRAGLTQLVWLASCIVDRIEPSAELLSRFGLESLYTSSRQAFLDRVGDMVFTA